MAIFEKSLQTKDIIDDTEKLICTIENAQNINKHTEYLLRVQRGPTKDNRWNVLRRYRDFAALHSSLQTANVDLPLPPKKLIGNMQPSFVAERQIALQKFIDEVLKNQVLALSLQVRAFLDPHNYCLDIAEQALQTVSIALRGDGRYELRGPLADIGWRIRKQYFLVADSDSKSNYLLSWQNYGPDRYLSDKDLQLVFKSLQNISHPHIDPILAVHTLEKGAYVVRKIHEAGSVRDLLYGTEYTKNHLGKYANPRIRKPFTIGQISRYGYQILLALKFLHDKGLTHGHVHPGNIAITNQNAVLMGLENACMGVPCQYRPYLVELRHTLTSELIDVYCFGRTLYEMAYAMPLEGCYCDVPPDDYIAHVLSVCLSSSSYKYEPPSVETLLGLPLFQEANMNGLLPLENNSRSHFKMPEPLKVKLKAGVWEAEGRLKADQKVMRKAKREVRIQEILGSEEEMKKQKRRAKQRSEVWKSSSSLAETRSRSASTASSPTPPHTSGETSATGSYTAGDSRAALLNSICAFNKSNLARVQTQS